MAATELFRDCLFEIFSRLPARQVFKFKTVGKSSLNFLSEQLFFENQTKHTKANSAIITHATHNNSLRIVFLDKFSGIPDKALDFMGGKSGPILASSNGLICFLSKNQNEQSEKLCVFNPVCQRCQYIFLPEEFRMSKSMYISVSMSFDKDMNYKLICTKTFSETGDTWRTYLDCRCYSSKDNSWEYLGSIYTGKRNIRLEDPVAAGGWVYWASDTGIYMRNTDPYILGFDIERRSSKMIELPYEVRRFDYDDYEISVASWADESLCLIQYVKSAAELSLWLMDSFSQQGSWTKIDTMSLESLGMEGKPVESFTLMNGDLLVLFMDRQVYTIDLNEKKPNKLEGHIGIGYPVLRSYANTLCSC